MQARNLTTNVPKILYLKSSSEQIFSKNCRWVAPEKRLYYREFFPFEFDATNNTTIYNQILS